MPDTTLSAGTIYDVVAIGRLAAIQVALASSTPAASTGSESAPQQLMPNTGATTSTSLLLMLGLLAVLGGFMLRRAVEQ